MITAREARRKINMLADKGYLEKKKVEVIITHAIELGNESCFIGLIVSW